MTESENILLKIISGPHLGAEIPLTPGKITLGSSNSCDIILQDSTVAENHLQIVIPEHADQETSISIKTLDAPVILLGQEETDDSIEESDEDVTPETESESELIPIKESSVPGIDLVEDETTDLKPGERLVEGEAEWKPLTPLMLGTTCIVWKLEKDSWKDIAATDYFLGKVFGRDDELDDASARDAEQEELEKKKRDQKIIILSPFYRNVLKIVAVVILFLFIFGPCIGTKSTRQAKDMRGVLKDEGYGYLKVAQTNIGVTILGTVDTQADRNKLWQIAGKMEYPVFIDIMVNEERAYAVKVALSVRGLFPEIELKDQDIIMKGYMRDKLIEGAAKVWIRNDIHDVKNIDSKMVYAFQVWPVLKDRLIKYDLGKFVVIRFHPGLVQVEGELNFDQREDLTKVKKEVREELNSPIAFWDTLTAPGFSDEWNASLASSLGSEFGPDPALARLFFDSQSAKGVPAFAAATPEFRAEQKHTPVSETPVTPVAKKYEKEILEQIVKDAEKVTDSKGRKLAVIKDKDGKIEGAVILDDKGKIKLTPSGKPTIVPVIKDKKGRIVKDKKGKPVFAQPLTDSKGKTLYVDRPKEAEKQKIPMPIARDDEGNILVDDKGRIVRGEVLRDEEGKIKRDDQGRILVRDSEGKIIPTRPAAKDDKGEILVDDKGRIVTGEVLKDKEGKVKTDEEGRILVKDSEGRTVSARPAVKDERGEVLVDDKGKALTGEILRDEEGQIKRDEEGRILVKDSEDRIVSARPSVKDEREEVLVDDQGKIVTGEILRDEEGKIKKDDQGRILVRDKEGSIVATRPLESPSEPVEPEQVPVIVGPVLDKEGKIIYDKDGKPIIGRAVVDKEGKVVTDEKGRPVILGTTLDEKGKPLRDADGEPIPLTVARDAEGDIVRDKKGKPLLLPALVDKEGRVVRDKKGKPVAPRVISGADKQAVFDTDGNVILDKDANKIFIEGAPDAKISGKIMPGIDTGPQDLSSKERFKDDLAPSDKDVFGSGTVVADKLSKEKEEDPLGGLVIVSITLKPIPFVSMKDGQKFFTGGKLPSGYIIRKILTDKLLLEKNGKTKILKMRTE